MVVDILSIQYTLTIVHTLPFWFEIFFCCCCLVLRIDCKSLGLGKPLLLTVSTKVETKILQSSHYGRGKIGLIINEIRQPELIDSYMTF